jgi:HEAT repeat protein
VARSGMRICPLIFLAVSAFAQSTEDKAWQTIEHALQNSNPAKRSAALLAMAVVRPLPRAVKLVETGLGDSDPVARQSTCAVLGGFKSKTSIPKLRDTLGDEVPEVAFAAAKALYEMGDPAGRQVLIAVLSGDQAGASGFVASSMNGVRRKLHDPKALLLVGVNSGAGFLIGPFGAGLPFAENLLKDKQASGKTVAALLLASDSTAESRDALKAAMGDNNWTVRAAAVRAVALRDLAALYGDVAFLLNDGRDEVQYAAAAALIRLKQPTTKGPGTKAARQRQP